MMRKLILIIGVVMTLCSCDSEVTIFDSINGQTGVSFGETSYNVSVPTEGLSIAIPVYITTVANMDRTINVSIDETSIGESANYTLGELTIPSGKYSGTLNVDLNFDPLSDGEVYKLVLELTAPDGGVAFDETVTIEYFKEIICNDFLLTIVTDTYGSETTWEITDESGSVVVSGGPYVDVSGGDTYTDTFYLADGCYTFTMYDAYGDGQQDGTNTGSYTLECSILQVLTGGGAFGTSQSMDFCVNQ